MKSLIVKLVGALLISGAVFFTFDDFASRLFINIIHGNETAFGLSPLTIYLSIVGFAIGLVLLCSNELCCKK